MYTGTLIEDLIQTVERAEAHARQIDKTQDQKLAQFYALSQFEMARLDSILAGVA